MFSLFWEQLSSAFDFDRKGCFKTLMSILLRVLSGGLKSGNVLSVQPTTFRLPLGPFPLLCEACLWVFSGFANGGRNKAPRSLFQSLETGMSLHEYTVRLNLLCLFSPGLPNCPPASLNSSLSSLPSTIVLRCRVIFNLGRNGTFCFMVLFDCCDLFSVLSIYWNTSTCSLLLRLVVVNLTWFYLDASYLSHGVPLFKNDKFENTLLSAANVRPDGKSLFKCRKSLKVSADVARDTRTCVMNYENMVCWRNILTCVGFTLSGKKHFSFETWRRPKHRFLNATKKVECLKLASRYFSC